MARKTGGRARAAVFLVISMAAAVVATLVIYRIIDNYNTRLIEATKEEKKVRVVAAAKTLLQGNTIRPEDLKVVELPPAYVPDAGIFNSVEEVVGRVPTERILPNEFVRLQRLADAEAGVGLNAIISQGYRAVSIDITGGAAVSGFVNPGNYIDILVTIAPDKGDKKAETITLLQAVEVLAVDSRMSEGGAGNPRSQKQAPSVTLNLTPEQAEQIIHARQKGRITLTLRNDVDVTEVETQGQTAKTIIGRPDAPAMAVKTLQSRKNKDGSITIFRGARQTRFRVNADGTIRK